MLKPSYTAKFNKPWMTISSLICVMSFLECCSPTWGGPLSENRPNGITQVYRLSILSYYHNHSNAVAVWCSITKLADFQFVHYLVTRLLGSNRELKQTQAAPCDQTLYPLSKKQRSWYEKSDASLRVSMWADVKLNVLFTLLALSLEETSSHHSLHILHPQHNRQSSSSSLSFVENWKEAHMKPSSLCVSLA